MRLRKRTMALIATLASIFMLALAASPIIGRAADHLDAPGLLSPEDRGDADINDVYVFAGEGVDDDDDDDDGGPTTVLAMTTNPAAGALSPLVFGRDILYQIKIDIDGDAVADIAYKARFKKERKNGTQKFKVKRATGDKAESNRPNGKTVARGKTGRIVDVRTGGAAFAGLRSDPFFFDLGGFLGTVEGSGTRMLNDGMESDPFADFNTLAIVLEVPDSELADAIGVWATTHIKIDGAWVQADRMGRPAINTVVNSSGPVVGAPSEAKNVYNAAHPSDDVADFTGAVVDALIAYSSLDSEGSYAVAEAEALAAVLLPDLLAFDKSSGLPPPLNGRALADDVIDTELNIVTGGDPLGLFPGRDAAGGITTDSIGAHGDYLAEFPYLGEPHS